MEKKFKFSDNPSVAKALYGGVIALLCVSAIIVGIVAANNRKKEAVKEPDNSNIGDNGENQGGNGGENEGEGENKGDKPADNEKLSFISPVAGRVMKEHSLTIPVFSETLEAWRIHTGIDISCEEGASVFAAADGVVTRVYNDPMLGTTVELKHQDGMLTRYSNLSSESLVSVGVEVL